eukprot:g9093.t1
MLSYGSCALLLEAVLFLAVAAVSAWEYHRSRQQSTVAEWGDSGGSGGGTGGHGRGHSRHGQRDGPYGGAGGARSGGGRRVMTLLQREEAESGNSGTQARHRINVVLVLACTARGLLTAYLSAAHAGVAKPNRGQAWIPCLAAPDLLYIALYGSLVVLLAEMRQIIAASKTRPVFLRAAVRWGFGAVLVVSLVVCSARWGADPLSRESLLLRKFLYLELGATYLVMLVAFFYFGVRVCVSVAASNKGLFYRTLALTLVCGVAMCTKGAFLVTAAASNNSTDALFPGSAGRDRFEALIALEELLPSIAVAYLTARGKGRRRRAEVYVRPTEGTRIVSRWNDAHHLYNSSGDTDTDPDVFSPVASTPGLRNIPFSYASSYA